ncbi:MAG TPA: hypothetical protein VGI95_20055 [Caulobacteraceae bacterium]
MDRLDNTVQIGADVRIPEPQRSESSLLQDGVAHRVVSYLPRIIRMMAAVHLDDETSLEADEVEIEPHQ